MRLVFRTSHGLLQVLEDRLEKVGLSATKLVVLERLAMSKTPTSLGVLAVHAACAKSNITQMIDRLEVEGLVARKADPEDRRSVLAALTQKGHARCEEALAIQREVAISVFTELSPEGRTELRTRLELLLRQIT